MLKAVQKGKNSAESESTLQRKQNEDLASDMQTAYREREAMQKKMTEMQESLSHMAAEQGVLRKAKDKEVGAVHQAGEKDASALTDQPKRMSQENSTLHRQVEDAFSLSPALRAQNEPLRKDVETMIKERQATIAMKDQGR